MKKKQKLELSPRVQLVLACVLPVVLVAAGWMLLVGPQRSKAAEASDQVAAKQTEIQLARAATIRSSKPQPIQVADIFRLITAMPDQEDMPGIILQLNQVAEESGIQFTSISPQGTTTGSAGYATRQIQLTFSGNFYGLSDFLYRLRSLVGVRGGKLDANGRLFSVAQVSFVEGKPAFPQINATLTLDAYMYGQAPRPRCRCRCRHRAAQTRPRPGRPRRRPPTRRRARRRRRARQRG